MRRCGTQRAVHDRAHLVEVNLATLAGRRQRRLGSRQAAANDSNSGWMSQLAGSVSAVKFASVRMASSSTRMMRHSSRNFAPRPW